jgi:hypothetical protein
MEQSAIAILGCMSSGVLAVCSGEKIGAKVQLSKTEKNGLDNGLVALGRKRASFWCYYRAPISLYFECCFGLFAIFLPAQRIIPIILLARPIHSSPQHHPSLNSITLYPLSLPIPSILDVVSRFVFIFGIFACFRFLFFCPNSRGRM